MKKSKLINQLISQPNTPINTPTQNQFTNCELEQIDKQAVEEKNCKECLHFEACCKWTDFPRQIGFPICRKFNPVESYRKQREGEWHTVVDNKDDIVTECSVCKYYFWFMKKGQLNIDRMPYCPNCGAKMKGGEEG